MSNSTTDRTDFVTLRELAERWIVSRQTVRRVLRENGLRPLVLNTSRNGTLRFRRSDVEALESSLTESLSFHRTSTARNGQGGVA